MKQSKSGFTIVELLIVIVIIAVLATISIVVYNGIVDRAKNANINSPLTAYINALEMYRVNEGHYPVPDDVSQASLGGWQAMCLGVDNDYPATSVFAAGMCTKSSVLNLPHDYTVTTSAQLQKMLSPYIARPPSVAALSDERLSIYPIRGMIYTPWYPDGSLAQLEYSLFNKTSTCPQGSANAGYFKDAVRCAIMLGK